MALLIHRARAATTQQWKWLNHMLLRRTCIWFKAIKAARFRVMIFFISNDISSEHLLVMWLIWDIINQSYMHRTMSQMINIHCFLVNRSSDISIHAFYNISYTCLFTYMRVYIYIKNISTGVHWYACVSFCLCRSACVCTCIYSCNSLNPLPWS